MFWRISAIAIKELKVLFRDGAALGVLFLLPVVFLTIMTFAGVGDQGGRNARILVVNQDQGPVAQWIIARLQGEEGLEVVSKADDADLNERQAEKMLLANRSEYALVMVFPSSFSSQLVAAADPAQATNTVRFIADPAFGGRNLIPIERLIKIQVMEVAGALLTVADSRRILQDLTTGQDVWMDALMYEYSQASSELPAHVQPNVSFERAAPQGLVMTRPIRAEEQNVPGYTIFGVFFIVQVIGNTILREKESGTLVRLLAAPVSRAEILLGKLIPFYFVNIVQSVFMFLFGMIVFDIHLGNSLGGLLLMILVTAAVANALGLLIAALSKSSEQMGPMSGLILVTLAVLGGILVPFFEMPKLMQQAAFFTPHAWALKGFQDILVRGYDFWSVLPTAACLLGFAVLFYLLALWRFRFN